MNHCSKCLTLSILLVTGVVIATGCGKSRPKELALSDAAIAGTWVETAPKVAASARRMRTTQQEFIRHLVMNADQTFVFSLRELDGSPTKDDKKIEGTWAIDSEQNVVALTVTNNPFKSSETGYDWVPETLSEMTNKEIQGYGKTDVIYATDVGARSARLVREP